MRRCWQWLLPMSVALGLVACGGDETLPQPPGEPPVEPPPPADPPGQVDTGPWVLDPARGQALFVEKCQRCHGENATGGYGPALTGTATCAPCAQFTMLWQRIDEFMPLRNPEACDAACARDIAAWITNGFSVAPSCSVEYVHDSVTAGQFVATLRIFNFRGQDVPVWRLGFTLPTGHRVTGVADAVMHQRDDQLLIEPPATRPAIRDGELLQIVLRGSHPGIPGVPTDLRLEAPPCFTVPTMN